MAYFYQVTHYRSRGNGVDFSNDTVEPQYLLNGYTAHNTNFSSIMGIYDPIVCFRIQHIWEIYI